MEKKILYVNKVSSFTRRKNDNVSIEFTTYVTGNISGSFCQDDGNGILLHVMSFQQVLAMCIGIVILKKTTSQLSYEYRDHT